MTIFPKASLAQTTVQPLSVSSTNSATLQGSWQQDAEVTFAGKMAARASSMLDSVITNYKWAYLQDGKENPFTSVWIPVRNVIYALLLLFILVAAFLLIVTQGRSITIKKFVPRFILVLVLITLSFSLVQFLYQITDIIQGFFLRPGGNFITSGDLLNISFNYLDFLGYRRVGVEFDEGVFMTTLLVKLTAATYYAMFIILIVRKVILWFFIAVSPIFPLLILYSPLRNSAKIWVGEFFRWLLYGPLFAIFLSGTVLFWRAYIPLDFKELPCDGVVAEDQIVFPTATNILLGGPCQKLAVNNNLNVPDAFVQYLVALIMLWIVIILPFLLLKIFLDYLANLPENGGWVKYLANSQRGLVERYGPSFGFVNRPSGPVGPNSPPGSTGAAKRLRSLEFFPSSQLANKLEEQTYAKNENVAERSRERMTTPKLFSAETPVATINSVGESGVNSSSNSNTNINSLGNKLGSHSNLGFSQSSATRRVGETVLGKGVGQFSSTTNISNTSSVTNTTNENAPGQINVHISGVIGKVSFSANGTAINWVMQPETIEILNLTSLSIPKMRDIARFEQALLSHQVTQRETVNREVEKLKKLAGTSPIAAPAEKEKFTEIKKKIESASDNGNPVAGAILEATKPLSEEAVKKPVDVKLPTENKIQVVNLDEYEDVKKTWLENYEKMETPLVDNRPMKRADFLNKQIGQIDEVIGLLNSPSVNDQQQAEMKVAEILPFLLLGGFSKFEIQTYLKAKEQAAKEVLDKTKREELDEENKVLIERKTAEKPKALFVEQTLDSDEEKDKKDH